MNHTPKFSKFLYDIGLQKNYDKLPSRYRTMLLTFFLTKEINPEYQHNKREIHFKIEYSELSEISGLPISDVAECHTLCRKKKLYT